MLGSLNIESRVGACHHGPHNILEIGRVDVIIHYDHIAAQIGSYMALGSHQPSLADVALIALLNSINGRATLRTGGFFDGEKDSYHLEVNFRPG